MKLSALREGCPFTLPEGFCCSNDGCLLRFGEQESTGLMAFRRTGVVAVVRCGVAVEGMLTQYVMMGER